MRPNIYVPLYIFYFLICTLIYTPLLILYLSNTSEGFTYSALKPSLSIAFIALIISTLISIRWKMISEKLETFFIGPTVYVFVVSTFFPIQSGALDGLNIKTNLADLIIYLGFFALLFCIPVIPYFKKWIGTHMKRSMHIIGAFIIIASLIFSIILFSKSNKIQNDSKYKYLFAEKNNIIVIIVDMVQNEFAKEYFRLNRKEENAFDGFTFYGNVSSFGASTNMSLYGIMRGDIPRGISDVASINYKNNILNDMTKNGYSVKYRAPVKYSIIDDNIVSIPEGIAFNKNERFLSFAYICSRRYLPFKFQLPSLHKDWGWMSKNDNKLFFEWLISNADVKELSSKSILWYHTLLPHSPVRFSSDGTYSFDLTPNDTMGEVSYTFNLLKKFINKIKKLGIYDDSLIFILADHGYSTLNEMSYLPPGKDWFMTQIDPNVSSEHPFVNLRIGQYSPLLMTKTPNEHGRLKYSNKAVTLLDLRKTLNEFVFGQPRNDLFGINILNSENGVVRRTVPIIRFTGDSFENKDYQSTENYIIDSLNLPFSENYNNGDYFNAIKDLKLMVRALELFHEEYGYFPKSDGFDGLYTKWGRSGKDWIRGLVPRYIDRLPRDPRKLTNPDKQYLYYSNGEEYKLISHMPAQFWEVSKLYPNLIDPMRPTWAYGFWTDGAEKK